VREVGEDAHGENGGGGPPPLKFEAYYDFVSQVRYTCMHQSPLLACYSIHNTTVQGYVGLHVFVP